MGGKRRGAKGRPSGQVIGRLSMTRHGYGFVEASEGDFFIPAKDIGGAMHGDMVAVRPETHRGRQGRAGVDRQDRRAGQHHTGRPVRPPRRPSVSSRPPTAASGTTSSSRRAGWARRRAATSWWSESRPIRRGHHSAQGYVEEIVGREGDPGIQIEIIIREHGLRTEFPAAAAEQAAAIKLDVAEALAAEPDRVDIRERFTFTIDPVDARDFDDAISIEHVD